jgi:hypothetical protein
MRSDIRIIADIRLQVFGVSHMPQGLFEHKADVVER